MAIIGIVMVVATILSILWLLPRPKKIFGVYAQPGGLYWFKAAFFYCVVNLRLIRNRFKADDDGTGYGKKSRSDIKLMECVQTLSDHPKAIDAVYFNAADADGNYFVAATARRPRGVINGVLYIRIPIVGTLELPRMPDTLMFGDGESFGAEGLKITPITPMKSWRIEYNGKMKQTSNREKMYDVQLDVLWMSNLPYFDFDTDMHPGALARSMALEDWSRQYFTDLKAAHQTHYEQMGKLNGTIKIDGEIHDLRLDSMRDHSYGYKREWRLMHRYALHMIHTENGLHINVGVVCQPGICSQLELGYMNSTNGDILPISTVNLLLWQHGEEGQPPKDYAFSFTAGGQEYRVEVVIKESPTFYIGWEWETKVFEQFASYKVNGIRGWGIAEWDYRCHLDRPSIYSQNDPKWTTELNKG